MPGWWDDADAQHRCCWGCRSWRASTHHRAWLLLAAGRRWDSLAARPAGATWQPALAAATTTTAWKSTWHVHLHSHPPGADLEKGDDPELLKSEDAVDIALMKKRGEMPLEAPPGATRTGPAEVYSHSRAASGPAILMASLETRRASGEPWSKEALTSLATTWREVRVDVWMSAAL